MTRRALIAGLLTFTACSKDQSATPAPTTPPAPPKPSAITSAVTNRASAPEARPAPAPAPGLASDPFELGVASGDPTDTSVILWTRLVGVGDRASVPVLWEISSNSFQTVVASGVTDAMQSDGHSIHVHAGGLTPNTSFSYRFRVDEFTSTPGRSRTFPANTDRPRRVRFGFGSCQNWQDGYFAAHRDIAAANLDFFVFLGDYIYEDGNRSDAVRAVTGGECRTLQDYRARYETYHRDLELQASHASCPWITMWDDHEVADNYAGLIPKAADASFPDRQAAAYQAWWENTATSLPRPGTGPVTTYRSLQFGQLAQLLLLDTRQYRSDQACGDVALTGLPACAEVAVPTRTMLGAAQEEWLRGALATSKAAWNILGNQVVMADARLGEQVLNYDQWDGYPAARGRLLEMVRASGLKNVVTITGDIHAGAVADLTVDDASGTEVVVATELVGTSISSGSTLPLSVEAAIDVFRSLKYLNVRQRGWVLSEVSMTGWRAEYRVVDNPADRTSSLATDATFAISADRPGARRLS